MADIEIPTLDCFSFTGPERRKIQEQFGHDFRMLHGFVLDRTLVLKGSSPDLKRPDGKPIYADEVLVAMLTVQRQRTDPTATEADLDDISIGELLRWEERTAPKSSARKPSTSRKNSRSKN